MSHATMSPIGPAASPFGCQPCHDPVIELAPFAVIKCTDRGKPMWANAAARHMFADYRIETTQSSVAELIAGIIPKTASTATPNSAGNNRGDSPDDDLPRAFRNRWSAQVQDDETILLYGQPVSDNDRHNEALDQLVAVGNRLDLTLDQRIHDILGIAYRYFGMDFGTLCRFEDGRVLVELTNNEHDFLYTGQTLPMDRTYCSMLSDKTPVIAIHDAGNQRLGPDHARERVQLRALLTLRLNVAGEVYGAISFGHRSARHTPFSSDEMRFVDLTARWIEYELEQRAQLTQLHSREKYFRSLYKRTPVMMFSVDCKGVICDASDRFLDTMELTRTRMLGRNYLDFLDSASLPGKDETHPARALALKDNVMHSTPLTFITAGGKRVEVELHATRHVADFHQGAKILCMVNDMTERNQAERDLAGANQKLTAANEGLQRFNMIASHDLQEPLRKIRAFGSLLKSELGHCLAGDSAYALNAMVNASRRLSDLVDDLLVLSRESNREYRKQPVALDTVFADIFLANGVGWEADPLPVVACDPVATGRIIENIASNARKYAHRDIGPHVTVTATRTGDSGYAIAFTDKGVGLHDIDPAELFEPFKRFCDDPEVPGTGVGLAICAAIAQGHGWTMRAEDVPETGARFIIQVPQRDIIVEPGHTPSVAPLHSDMDALEDEELERMAPYSAA